MSYTENYPQQQNYFKLEWTLCEDNLSRAHVFFASRRWPIIQNILQHMATKIQKHGSWYFKKHLFYWVKT